MKFILMILTPNDFIGNNKGIKDFVLQYFRIQATVQFV